MSNEVRSSPPGPAGHPPRQAGRETSPAWRWLGISLAELGEGSATVEMTPSEDMANHAGFVHGGMISALADSAMGRSLRTLKPGVARAMRRASPTRLGQFECFDLKLSFISAAKVGETLRATGSVVHAGRRTAVAECRVETPEGRLIATASGTFAITREKE